MLLLNPSADETVRADGSSPPTYINGCEITSNSTSSRSVFLQGFATLDTRVTTPGGIAAYPPASVTGPNPGGQAVADPYAATLRAPSGALGWAQFRTAYGQFNGLRQTECIEYVAEGAGGGNVGFVDWSQNLATTLNPSGQPWIPSLHRRGYSSYVGADGRRVHNIGGAAAGSAAGRT